MDLHAPENSTKKENFQRHGSMRKVIPVDTGNEDVFDRRNEAENLYKVYRQEYVLLAEYKMVQEENIFGVYVIPSRESPLIWFGVIFVRRGYYEDGVFRFNIFLDEKFPDSSHPKVIFQSKLFHPVINPESGELHLLGAFPEWNKSEQHLWQILKYVQWIFYEVENCLNHAVNSEAAEMFKTDRDSFKSKAATLVQLSHAHLYDPPPTEDAHYICFEPYAAEVHDKVRTAMIEAGRRAEQTDGKAGLSWVLPGSGESLTRPPTPQGGS